MSRDEVGYGDWILTESFGNYPSLPNGSLKTPVTFAHGISYCESKHRNKANKRSNMLSV
jgi:hypothetical protein